MSKWGFLYDAQANTRTLPSLKLEKASYLLRLTEFELGARLAGQPAILGLGAPFTQGSKIRLATNALLGPPTSEGLEQPRGDCEEQSRAWKRFWEPIELQRRLVDNRAQWRVRFTHPMTDRRGRHSHLQTPRWRGLEPSRSVLLGGGALPMYHRGDGKDFSVKRHAHGDRRYSDVGERSSWSPSPSC